MAFQCSNTVIGEEMGRNKVFDCLVHKAYTMVNTDRFSFLPAHFMELELECIAVIHALHWGVR